MRRKQIVLVLDASQAYCRALCHGVARFNNKQDAWDVVQTNSFVLKNVPDPLAATDSWFPGLAGMISLHYSDELIQFAARRAIPLVNTSSREPHPPMPTVTMDNHRIGVLAAEHLIEAGYRHFGCLSLDFWFAHERQRGFEETLAAAGFPPPFIKPDPLPAEEWLPSLPRPIGVFCVNDARALAVARACKQLEYRVPDEVGVLGTDNDEITVELTRPKLSSVDPNGEEIGYRAAEALQALIDGKQIPPMQLIPPNSVIARESTDPILVDDVEIRAALRFIRQTTHPQVDVGELVEHLCVSRRALERHFREALGRTPGEEFRRVRLQRARRLLDMHNLSISQVAESLGYESQKQFSEAFRKMTGVSPRQWRKTRLTPTPITPASSPKT